MVSKLSWGYITAKCFHLLSIQSQNIYLFLVFVNLVYLGDGFLILQLVIQSTVFQTLLTGFFSHEFPGSFELFLPLIFSFISSFSIYFSFVFVKEFSLASSNSFFGWFLHCNSSQPVQFFSWHPSIRSAPNLRQHSSCKSIVGNHIACPVLPKSSSSALDCIFALLAHMRGISFTRLAWPSLKGHEF